jgi:hypothetical protein
MKRNLTNTQGWTNPSANSYTASASAGFFLFF